MHSEAPQGMQLREDFQHAQTRLLHLKTEIEALVVRSQQSEGDGTHTNLIREISHQLVELEKKLATIQPSAVADAPTRVDEPNSMPPSVDPSPPTIFARLLAGEAIPFGDPEYRFLFEAVSQTRPLLIELNNASDPDMIRALLGRITHKTIDPSTTVFPPLSTNFGRHITLGKNVFINHASSFLDLGGITIDDNVMIAPRVTVKIGRAHV